MLRNLKTIKLTNFSWEDGVLQFLKFMLANSKVLKSLTVEFSRPLFPNQEGKLKLYILMLPRASKDCELHFVKK